MKNLFSKNILVIMTALVLSTLSLVHAADVGNVLDNNFVAPDNKVSLVPTVTNGFDVTTVVLTEVDTTTTLNEFQLERMYNVDTVTEAYAFDTFVNAVVLDDYGTSVTVLGASMVAWHGEDSDVDLLATSKFNVPNLLYTDM